LVGKIASGLVHRAMKGPQQDAPQGLTGWARALLQEGLPEAAQLLQHLPVVGPLPELPLGHLLRCRPLKDAAGFF
jgi:hypothetical protein